MKRITNADVVSGGPTDDEVIAARSVLYRNYYYEVEAWGRDYERRLKDGDWDNEDAFWEAFDEETDGASCVIYTAEAHDVVHASVRSADALDEISDMGFDARPDFVSVWALFCLRCDLKERLGDISHFFDAIDSE